jgi:ABC-2 type transport system ATP-binding protein
LPALELMNLDKSYADIHALREMSLTVESGEIFGFVGSNGAGKTTAMRIAVGVLAADAGEVRWAGQAVDLTVSRRIGYMPEERGLYPRMKVGHQLRYLARLHGRSPEQAEEAVQRWTQVLGISSRVDDEVQKLSLGNQQRVQLCAALVFEPDILVLDEPFSGLDPVAVDVMSQVLRDRADAGVPVLFSSHQLDLVERLCDRVGIIKEGSMVAIGSIDELRSRGGLRWQVEGAPAATGWPGTVPGARVVSSEGTVTVVELDRPAEANEAGQQLLRAAMAVGPVHAFGRVRPHLAELFRHAVSDTVDASADDSGKEASA